MNKNETVCIIRSLLSSTNSSFTVYSLNKDFKNETGIDIPLFGYNNLNDFLCSIPDTVRLTGIYPVQQVHLVGHEKSAHIVHLVQRQKKSLKYSKNNFERKIPTKLDKLNESHFLMVPNKKGTLDSLNKFSDSSQRMPVMTESRSITSFNISNINYALGSTLEFGEKISPIDLNCHAKIGEYVEVCASEVYHPHRFYLRFRKLNKQLLGLIEESSKFYFRHEDAFHIPEGAIKPGQTCIALYEIHPSNRVWLRAEIRKILNPTKVIAKLVDFGTNIKITQTKLRYLHRDFSSLPKQALLASLANIKPSENSVKWPKLAKMRFSDLIMGRDLIAGVVSLNNRVPWINVALSYTAATEIHINDTLVRDGLAVLDINLSEKYEDAIESDGSTNQCFFSNEKPILCDKQIKFLCSKSSEAVNSCDAISYFPKNDRLKQLFQCKS